MTWRRLGGGRRFLCVAVVLVVAGYAVSSLAPASGAQEPGQAIVFSTDAGASENMQIAVMQSDGSGVEVLTPSPPRADGIAAFSPDGKRIAFSTDDDGVWLSRPDGSGARRLSSVHASSPRWSPDGTKLALSGVILDTATGQAQRVPIASQLGAWSPDSRRFAAGSSRPRPGVWLYSAVDGTKRLLTGVTRHETVGSVSWSRNGKWLVYSVDSDVRAGLDVRAVTSSGEHDHLVAHGFDSPAVSPDGTRVAMTTSFTTQGVWIAPIAGGRPQRVANPPGHEGWFAWSADGRALVLLADRHPYVVRLPAGPAVPLTRRTWPRGIVGSQVWAPDGSGVIAGDEPMRLVRPTGTRRPFLFRGREDAEPVVAPDGRIAFVRGAAGVYRWTTRVLVMRRDGTRVVDAGPGRGPRWSKDGSLAFVSGDGEIVVLARGGKGRHTGLHADTLAWSPDGRELAYSSGDELWRARSDGTRRRLVVRLKPLRDDCYGLIHGNANRISRIVWSPDGRRLGYVEGFMCGKTTRLVDVDGTHRRILEGYEGYEDGGDFSWSPDGRRLAFASDSLYVANANGTSAQPVLDAEGEEIPAVHVAWAPDRSRIVVDTPYSTLLLVDPAGGEAITVGPQAHNADPAWD